MIATPAMLINPNILAGQQLRNDLLSRIATEFERPG